MADGFLIGQWMVAIEGLSTFLPSEGLMYAGGACMRLKGTIAAPPPRANRATRSSAIDPVDDKTHLAIAIARAYIQGGARGRFFNVDLVNRLEAEARAGEQGRMADYLSRMAFNASTNWVTCRSLSPTTSSCSTWSASFTNNAQSSSPPTSRFANGPRSSVTAKIPRPGPHTLPVTKGDVIES